ARGGKYTYKTGRMSVFRHTPRIVASARHSLVGPAQGEVSAGGGDVYHLVPAPAGCAVRAVELGVKRAGHGGKVERPVLVRQGEEHAAGDSVRRKPLRRDGKVLRDIAGNGGNAHFRRGAGVIHVARDRG